MKLCFIADVTHNLFQEAVTQGVGRVLRFWKPLLHVDLVTPSYFIIAKQQRKLVNKTGMQVTREILFSFNKRIFLAFTLILLLGNSAQGAPPTKARYQWVRCRPDSNSANCIEEKGPWLEYVQGGANNILPPRANPFLMKNFQEEPESSLFSEEESGSGTEVTSGAEPEPGSGTENDVDYYDFIVNRKPGNWI
ncbi:serglycin [Rhinatrema bivittatum]|uniref:serglycin n=1 Tax=Rhinatrema bivittatum TaxID=194408 RepID=UPI00112C1F1D|nr:serglycin [Rhinatrema bivittatum]